MNDADSSPVEREAAFVTRCTSCGLVLHGFCPSCPACGAMSDIAYDLAAVRLRESADPYERFIDLLPVADQQLLPPSRFTPTVHAQRLGEHIGLRWLYLKDETVLPTGSTKDRMAAVALAYLHESGVEAFTTSSTGNSSTAYAQAISRIPSLGMYVFTAAEFRARLALPESEQVIDVVLDDASFVEAFAAAGELADRRAIASERGFFNPARREGLKLAWLEAAEQVPRPIDWYVQAVSSAMGVYGVHKGARELAELGRSDRIPRLLCVQQESCAPMVAAWRDRAEQIRASDIVERPHGIAAAILRGDPSRVYPHVRRIVAESDGAMIDVSEGEIRLARELMERLEGIRCCFAAAAALAGLIKLSRGGEIAPDDTFLVNVTGRDRHGTPAGAATHTLSRTSGGWDLDALPELAAPGARRSASAGTTRRPDVRVRDAGP